MQTDRDRLIKLVEDGFPKRYELLLREDIEEIADHLLANGVIVLPCKVGDMVYETDGVRIYESEVTEIYQDKIAKIIYCTTGIAFDERAIGHSIFLTKEEAEAKLRERKEDEGK